MSHSSQCYSWSCPHWQPLQHLLAALWLSFPPLSSEYHSKSCTFWKVSNFPPRIVCLCSRTWGFLTVILMLRFSINYTISFLTWDACEATEQVMSHGPGGRMAWPRPVAEPFPLWASLTVGSLSCFLGHGSVQYLQVWKMLSLELKEPCQTFTLLASIRCLTCICWIKMIQCLLPICSKSFP